MRVRIQVQARTETRRTNHSTVDPLYKNFQYKNIHHIRKGLAVPAVFVCKIKDITYCIGIFLGDFVFLVNIQRQGVEAAPTISRDCATMQPWNPRSSAPDL